VMECGRRCLTSVALQESRIESTAPIAAAFAPCLLPDPKVPVEAERFVQLLLTVAWDPVFEDLSDGHLGTESPQRRDDGATSPASSDSVDQTRKGDNIQSTGTGLLFQADKAASDSSSAAADDETTVVETFRQSPPSTANTASTATTAVAAGAAPPVMGGGTGGARGPAWSAELAQEDVLSSLEFANSRFISAATLDGDDNFDGDFDDGFDDLEVETIM
jgi:hypothetical protein